MKEINAAYDYLKYNTKTNSESTLEQYKKKKFEQLKKNVHYDDFDKIKDDGFKKHLNLIIRLVKEQIEVSNSTRIVDEIINQTYKTFDDSLHSKVHDFCEQKGIEKQELNNLFNLELELKKRNPYELCTKLEDALGKIKASKIEKTVIKYVTYAGYTELEGKIKMFMGEAVNSDDKISIIIENLQKSIDDAFEKHFANMKLANELFEIVKEFDDKEILEEVNSLLQNIDNSFFKEQYEHLKRKVNERQSYDNLFANLNKRGADALNSCSSVDDMVKIYAVLTKISELLLKVKKDNMFLDEGSKNKINLITFKDYEKDMNMLDSLLSIEEKIQGIDNIYIKMSKYATDLDRFFFFVKKDDVVYEISDKSVYPLPSVFVPKYYIPLAEFLERGQILKGGYRSITDENKENRFYEICSYDERSIWLMECDGEIWIKLALSGLSKFLPIRNDLSDKYKDKNYLASVIAEQLNKILDEELGNKSFAKRTKKVK